jgi:hypothetical protein
MAKQEMLVEFIINWKAGWFGRFEGVFFQEHIFYPYMTPAWLSYASHGSKTKEDELVEYIDRTIKGLNAEMPQGLRGVTGAMDRELRHIIGSLSGKLIQ